MDGWMDGGYLYDERLELGKEGGEGLGCIE